VPIVVETLPPTETAHDPRRAWLVVLTGAWGVQAIVTQSLLLREGLVFMFGSEFAWGVVLFAWLFGVAIGATVGGRLARQKAGPNRSAGLLIIVLLALSLSACAELWVFRGARGWLSVGQGELAPLHKTALAAMLFVSPCSALVGMAFPLACGVGKSNGDAGRVLGLSFGHVYAVESAGSLVGGAVFSFWAVERLAPIQTALSCGALTTAAAAGLLLAPPRAPLRAVGLLLVASILLLTAIFAGDGIDRGLVQRRWENLAAGYELVAETESKYQNLAVGRRAGQYSLYCDGQLSADFPDPYTFAPLAHFWMCQHPEPRHVLVLGGGAEGLLAQILTHPVNHVDYIEPDPKQIELIEPFLAEADRRALHDARVTVHHADARYFVKTQRGRFDLVIARLPAPTSALHARFHTDEFYGELRRAMTERGVLCMAVAAAPGELTSLTREYLGGVRATLGLHFPHITVGWGDPAHILAAVDSGLTSIDPAVLAARYARRGVTTDMFHPAWFDGASDWLIPEKIAQRKADLDTLKRPRVSTDARPIIYVQRLALWEQQSRDRAVSRPAGTYADAGPGLIQRLQSIRMTDLIAVLLVACGLTLGHGRLRHGARVGWAVGAVNLSVATTGFVTMALSIVWLYAFQNLYGYVYQRIGWIIALFMAGLVTGCLVGQRLSGRAERAPWKYLVLADALLGLLALSAPFILPALGELQAGPGAFTLVEWCISILVTLTGLFGGAVFALAGGLHLLAVKSAGPSAAAVVGADHAGACLGALLCGLLLAPVFGTLTAALLLAGLKLVSVLALLNARRLRPMTAPRF